MALWSVMNGRPGLAVAQLALELGLVLLAMWWAGRLERSPERVVWWHLVLAALPAMVVGSLILALRSEAGIVDGDAVANTRLPDQSVLAYLFDDGGMPGRVHAMLRMASGTAASVPDGWALGRVLFVGWALAAARLGLRWLPWWAVAPALFVWTIGEITVDGFGSSRAYMTFLLTSMAAVGLAKSSPRWAVALLGLAVLDNPLCVVLVPLVVRVPLALRFDRDRAVVASCLMAAALPSAVGALVLHTDTPALDEWDPVVLAMVACVPLMVPPKRESPEYGWTVGAVVVVIAAMALGLTPAAPRVVAFILPIAWLVGLAGLSGRVGSTAVGVLLAVLGLRALDPAWHLRWWQPLEDARAAEAVARALDGPAVVVPGHAYEAFLTASGLSDGRDLTVPPTPRHGLRPGPPAKDAAAPCGASDPPHRVVLFARDADEVAWGGGCGPCEVVAEAAPWRLVTCEADDGSPQRLGTP